LEMAESELRRCYNNKNNNVQNEFLQEENEILKQKLEIHMNLWDLDKQQMESDFFAVGCSFHYLFSQALCRQIFFSCFVLILFRDGHEITILESRCPFSICFHYLLRKLCIDNLCFLSRLHETIILA
jgi:hypothetical protein